MSVYIDIHLTSESYEVSIRQGKCADVPAYNTLMLDYPGNYLRIYMSPAQTQELADTLNSFLAEQRATITVEQVAELKEAV